MSVIAKLMAGIGLNTDEFKRGIAEVGAKTQETQRDFANLKRFIADAFSTMAIKSFLASFANAALSINAAASAAGATTTGFQALKFAVSDNGLSADKLNSALVRLDASMIQALDDAGAQRKAFAALGISMDDVAGKPTDEVFGMIADAVSGASDKTDAYNAIIDLFGKKMGGYVLPMLKVVSDEGFANLTKEVRESGRAISELDIARVIDLTTRLDKAVNIIRNSIIRMVDYLGATITGIINGFEQIGGAGWAEGFRQGAEAYANDRLSEIQAIESAQREANKKLVVDAGETYDKMAGAAEKAADRTARAAEEAADMAIAAALKASYEMWAPLEKASKEYAEASEKDRLDQMSAEEKLNEKIELRAGLLKQLGVLEEEKRKYTLQWFTIAAKVADLNVEIRRGEKDAAEETKTGIQKTAEAKAEDVRVTMEQVKAIKALRQLIKSMTDEELTAFRNNLKKVHDAVAGLDFSNLNGLYALKDFKLPSTSVNAAERFGNAIAAMFDAIAKAPVIPDLSQLEKLKGFDVAAGADVRLGKLGKALLDFVSEYGRKGIDLSPFDSLTKLVDALAGGASVSIDINAPTKEQLTLQVPSDFEGSIKSIDGNLAVLARLKGVIFK